MYDLESEPSEPLSEALRRPAAFCMVFHADLTHARQHRFGCRQNVPFGALAIELQQVNARQSEIGNQPGKRDHRHLFGGRGGCRILAAVAVGVGDAFVASERGSARVPTLLSAKNLIVIFGTSREEYGLFDSVRPGSRSMPAGVL